MNPTRIDFQYLILEAVREREALYELLDDPTNSPERKANIQRDVLEINSRIWRLDREKSALS